MGWTTPTDRSTGYVVTAADWNIVEDNLTYLDQPNLYRCEYYRNAAWTAGTTDTIVPFDTKVYDTSSNFSTGSNLFTCPVAGIYVVDTCIQITPNTLTQLRLYHNGAPFRAVTNATAAAIVNLSTSCQCAAGDTLGIYARASAASSAGQTGQISCYASFRLHTAS